MYRDFQPAVEQEEEKRQEKQDTRVIRFSWLATIFDRTYTKTSEYHNITNIMLSPYI